MKEKNFKFRESFGKLVEQMTDKQAGEFIKAVSRYVFGGKTMESKDEFLKGVFHYVQNVLDTAAQNRENGKIGGAIVAEKRRKLRNILSTEDVSETSVVSQLIILSSCDEDDVEEGMQTQRNKPYKERGRPKQVNAYGKKYPNENKDDHKAV